MLYAGLALECKGQFSIAKGLLERSYAMLARLLGSSHGETARSLCALADVSRSMGKLDVSRAQHDVAMQGKRAAFSGLQADVALSYCGMGETYMAMGQHTPAYILFLKAVCIQRPQLGDRHPALFSSLMGLGACLRAMGRVCSNPSVVQVGVLCCTVLWCSLCCAVLCYAMLCCAMLCCAHTHTHTILLLSATNTHTHTHTHTHYTTAVRH
jgi:hypothetical protein